MGVVYHANYLSWFEGARNELIRSWGIPYHEFTDRGIGVMVIGAELKWLYPARFDDLLEVRTHLREASAVRCTFQYEVFRQGDGRLLCTGLTRHVFANAEGRPVAIPKVAPALWEQLQKHIE